MMFHCERCNKTKSRSHFTIAINKTKKCDKCLSEIGEVEAMIEAEREKGFQLNTRITPIFTGYSARQSSKEIVKVRRKTQLMLDELELKKIVGE